MYMWDCDSYVYVGLWQVCVCGTVTAVCMWNCDSYVYVGR